MTQTLTDTAPLLTVIPVDLTDSSKADFEALGFKFGDVIEGDTLFQEVTLPLGWSREGSTSARWSYLLDEVGTHRAAIFCAPGFYEGSVSIYLLPQS